MNKRTLLLSLLGTTTLGLMASAAALAQSGFPSQPIRIIVATPAGGISDTAARLVAQSLSRNLGQPVLVENRPGGNGVPALQAVLTAPPDGHTLLWAMFSMAGMPLLVKSAPIKSLSELTPISPVMTVEYGVFLNPKVPATTLGELTAYLKANPDRLNYGTGVLSEYLFTAHYLRAVGARALRVPYKGGVQVIPDLISGELQFYIGSLAPGLPHVRSGKLRLLATLPGRSNATPGVPALAETGVAVDGMPTWNGLVAPPGTPREIAARLAQEVNRALADPAVRGPLETQGVRVTGGTPQQMGEAIESAAAVWRQFVREYDIAPE